MNKPYNIQNTNICNGIFHISFFKAVLINEGETTRGERESKYGKYHCKYSYFGCCKACSWYFIFCLPHNYTVTCFLDVFNIMYCFTLCLTPDSMCKISLFPFIVWHLIRNMIFMNKPYNIQNTNICNGIFHIWYCLRCALPNYSNGLFESLDTLSDTNMFDSLHLDISTYSDIVDQPQLFDTWYEIWYLLLLNIREISIWRRVSRFRRILLPFCTHFKVNLSPFTMILCKHLLLLAVPESGLFRPDYLFAPESELTT
jgi:hypothetical protein